MVSYHCNEASSVVRAQFVAVKGNFGFFAGKEKC
jgi:hypothetical protein